jgi:hypothetical protein
MEITASILIDSNDLNSHTVAGGFNLQFRDNHWNAFLLADMIACLFISSRK